MFSNFLRVFSRNHFVEGGFTFQYFLVGRARDICFDVGGEGGKGFEKNHRMGRRHICILYMYKMLRYIRS